MRLINASTLELCDFYLTEAPPYMILSHTWGPEEVTYQDMSSAVRHRKLGYDKIEKTCRLALEEGLEYVWVDTCCIDKSSSAELTESINSMFSYYANAVICVVYLVDLLPDRTMGASKCRWFTRGWTLQELLAPRKHAFYDKTWTWIGSKSDLIQELTSITKIPSSALSQRKSISEFSIATRMSWAADRQTTRLEDIAYCLLGIFDVNMPLIYGEGRKAFRRLQLEIMKGNNDLTILAWIEPEGGNAKADDSPYMSLLARSPHDFSMSADIRPFKADFPEFSVTNKGLVVSPDVPLPVLYNRDTCKFQQTAMFLGCHGDNSTNLHAGILLKKVGPGLFYRQKQDSWIGFDKPVEQHELYYPKNATPYCIMIDPDERSLSRLEAFREHAIYVHHEKAFRIARIAPENLWDPAEQAFLKPKTYGGATFPVVLGIWFETESRSKSQDTSFVVLCASRTGVPQIAVIRDVSYLARLERTLFSAKQREASLSWHELKQDFPAIGWMRDQAMSMANKAGHRIHVSRTQDSPRSVSVVIARR